MRDRAQPERDRRAGQQHEERDDEDDGALGGRAHNISQASWPAIVAAPRRWLSAAGRTAARVRSRA